jgi:hypothetical protein
MGSNATQLAPDESPDGVSTGAYGSNNDTVGMKMMKTITNMIPLLTC